MAAGRRSAAGSEIGGVTAEVEQDGIRTVAIGQERDENMHVNQKNWQELIRPSKLEVQADGSQAGRDAGRRTA